MQLCDAGPKVVKYILSELENGYRIIPAQFSLKEIESNTGVRAQSIGMSFDAYIFPALLNKNLVAKKCGAKGRTVIQLSNK